MQGVEHFYLYNNNSTDDYLSVLQSYIDAKEVTLEAWPYTYEEGNSTKWLSIQTKAYTHCIKKYRQDTNWLAVIDTDEFLFCPNGQTLPKFLESYRSFGGVCVNWHLFGTSDVETVPSNFLMIELLTRCSPFNLARNRQVKSIVQPKYVDYCKTPHDFAYKKGYFAVCPDKKQVIKIPLSSSCRCHNTIRINHYWTRTNEYFREKKISSRQTRRNFETNEDLIRRAEEYNTCTDDTILQFVPALRKKMGFD